jgi:hypothetical protein
MLTVVMQEQPVLSSAELDGVPIWLSQIRVRQPVRYVVLHDLRRARLSDPFSAGLGEYGGQLRGSSDLSTPPEPRIDVENTDTRGRSDLVRDPEPV